MVIKNIKKLILFFILFLLVPFVFAEVNINSLNNDYYSYQDELTLNFMLVNETIITNTSTTCNIQLINNLGSATQFPLLYENSLFYVTYDISNIIQPTNYNYVVTCTHNSQDYIYTSSFVVNDTGSSQEYNFLALVLFFILIIFMALFISFKLNNPEQITEEESQSTKGIKFFGIGLALVEILALTYLIFAYVLNRSIHTIIRIHNIYILITVVFLIITLGFMLMYKLIKPDDEEEENNQKWQ